MSSNAPQYKTWTWTHPLMLHWMINPGLAINEVFLGQRVPRKMLIEKDDFSSLMERTKVPCPHCNTLHPAAKWSVENNTAFGNWFGLYCDHCEKTIPCLPNITSLVLWGISYPFWAPFRKTWKAKWLDKQRQRFARPLELEAPSYNWLQSTIGFMFIIYLFKGIVWPLIEKGTLNGGDLGTAIVPVAIGGLLYGLFMRFFTKARRSRKETTTA
jgi:hypothetical protein